MRLSTRNPTTSHPLPPPFLPLPQVDLGAMYNVRRVVIFNRWISQYVSGGNSTGGCCSARIRAATVTLRNNFQEVLQTFTLGANWPVYSIPVTLPTPTPTLTVSPLPSMTASATSTLSAGAAASATATRTIVPVPVPNAVEVRNTGGNALGLTELLAFTASGRLLNAAPGAVASTSTIGNASLVNDWCWNSYNTAQCPPFVGTELVAPSSVRTTWVNPEPVASVWFINRAAGTALQQRIIQSQSAFVDVVNADGTVSATLPITTAAIVSTLSFAPMNTAPTYPDASSPFQTSEANRQSLPRYAVITAPNAQFLNFKELMVFDTTNANVAFRKPVTGMPMYMGDAVPYLPQYTNDMIVNMDADTTNLVHSVGAGGFVEIDLGGLYDVNRIAFFNRPTNAGRISGGNVTLLNW